LFRPTKPKGKILQNLLQSHEIKFGNVFEIVIEEYFKENGFEFLNRKIDFEDKKLDIDQIFYKDNIIYFIEQKIRDDHDSSKKRGQIDNFEKKIFALQNLYPNFQIIGIFYFIDPSLQKNKNFYLEELQKLSKDYDVKLYLFYGKELFDAFNMQYAWEEITNYLRMWKREIPDVPEINFDLNAYETFEEIKDLSPAYYRKLFSNDEIFMQVLSILFPEKKTLSLLLNYFDSKRNLKIYNTLFNLLKEKLERI
jgi:Holliday junction resolvase-like predicted endonuclease